MNFDNYSIETRQLIDNISGTVQSPRSHVFSLLRKLEPIAKETKDNSLLGFVYYCYAMAYLSRDKHEPFIEYLKLAVKYLLRTGEKDYLARAYNLFAVDAKTNGCFDIAYDYYKIASSFVEDDKNSLARAMMDANMGDLLHQMGNYKKACSYIKKSIPVIKRHEEEATFFKNTIIIQTNLGLCYLSLNNDQEAKKIIDELDQYNTDDFKVLGEEIVLIILLLKLRYSLSINNHDDILKWSKQCIEALKTNAIISELVIELRIVINELLNKKYTDIAGEMIEIMSAKMEKNTYAAMILADLKKDYYQVTNKPEKMLESYVERDRLTREQMRIQNRTTYESIEFMRLLEELRIEKTKAKEENILLQSKAETDALTKLPNRYSLNRHIEQAFQKALEDNSEIGLGLVDVDDFKNFNDTYGHLKGDECLIAVADVLSDIARENDVFVARYGGDEFVLLYIDKTRQEILKMEKEMLKRSPISITHGFTIASVNEQTKIWDYIAEADRILYEKKKAR